MDLTTKTATIPDSKIKYSRDLFQLKSFLQVDFFIDRYYVVE